MRWERMGFNCNKWDLLLRQKLSRIQYTIRLLMGVVATPSLQVFKMLGKHLSGMISVELLLLWGMEMDQITSGDPSQPCFLWALIQDFSLFIPWSPKGDRTITLHFYPYTIIFAGWFLLIQWSAFSYICHMIPLQPLCINFFFPSPCPLGLLSLFFKWISLTLQLSERKSCWKRRFFFFLTWDFKLDKMS